MEQHVSRSAEEWHETTRRKAQAKSTERKSSFETSSDIPVHPLYTEEDTQALNLQERIGFPGEFPYARGIHPGMYRSRLWTMRQYAGFGTAEESNQRYRYLLSQGTTGLSVAFDLPTQIGYDADHSLSEGEVGKVGVSISSLEDMETLLSGLPLEKISTSMTINATASILLALYIAVAKKQGVDPRKISGTIQNDVLKEYIARGTYIYPPDTRCVSSQIFFSIVLRTFHAGTPSASVATIFERPARRRLKKSLLPSLMRLAMYRPRWTLV
ncbi:hypothetical protein KSX_29180 [Ktedonospora formicarum]|uniref:Methylmalonyl-CoA mutase alpha/beta chain catalytic domain-containing protein n=1 Tax=Ktedonospora formicarum TaxID=2778364 RepID=A0A8J3MR78_9CHLR|nr:hypothetical protein KSX_29180 [Ktedonospora formicarum]